MTMHSSIIKRTLAFALSFLMVFSIFTATPLGKASAAPPPKKYVKSLSVSPSKVTLKGGQKKTVTAKVSVKGSAKKKVSVSSSNAKTVTVKVGKANSKGVTKLTLTAKKVTKKSSATIKVTTVDKNSKKKKLSKSIKVTVNPAAILPQKVTVSAKSTTITAGSSTVVTATVSPSNATNKSVVFSSSNPFVASVNNSGTVLGISPGTAKITAKTSNGKSASVNITVKAPVILPQSVTVTAASSEILVGGSTTVSATILPENATNKSVSFSSSDASIASVDNNGLVTGISPGTATITAKTSNGKVNSVTITVKAPEILPQEIAVSIASSEIIVGDSTTVSATVLPENATDKSVSFSSSDASIASVDNNGLVTGISPGTAKITVSTHNGKTSSVDVIVKPAVIFAESVTLTAQEEKIVEGSSTTLTVTVLPEDTTDKTVSFISNNTFVATVSEDGVVTAVSAGTAKITATTINGKSASVDITVEPLVILPESVSLEIEPEEIPVGSAAAAKAKILPEDATEKTVTFKSENEDIATVNSEGVIIGISPGTATITVTTSNDKSASAKVTVNEVPVTSVTVDPASREITLTETTTLSAEIAPANATNKTLTWSSTEPNVATVDQNGVVRGIGEGDATIRATATNGIYGECAVHVKREIAEADGVYVEMTNPYKTYANTTLVGNDMSIRVRVIKNGKAVGNTSVTLTMTPLYGNCADAFTVRTPTSTTDDNGYANFAIGLKSGEDLNATSEYYQSFIIKAKDSSSNVEKELTVSFASVRINGISVLNGTENYPDIRPSTNADWADTGIYASWYLDSTKPEEYVTSQQNSSDEGDDNRVYLSATPELLLPITAETALPEIWEQNVENGASGPCSIYNDVSNETTTVQVQPIPAGLKYIRLIFDKINISPYTTMNVDIYNSESGSSLYHEEFTAAKNNSSGTSGIQIEEQFDVSSYLVISLISQGQVDTSSDGYILKRLEGVWASTNNERNDPQPIPDSVTWTDDFDSVTYENFSLSYEEAEKYFPADSSYLNKNFTYSYQIPMFPQTGNAYISVEDTHGNKTTFLYPTINNGSNRNILAEPEYGISAVMIANDAVNKKAGVLTTDGNIAIVDAKELGSTFLKATVQVDGLKPGDLSLNNGSTLYTSIQWVNVPNQDVEEKIPDYFAIEGQSVTVTAQLYDKNGQKATDPGIPITFSYFDPETEELIDIDLTGSSIGSSATLIEVTNKGATDGDGGVSITFRDVMNNDTFSLIQELTAVSSNRNYNVQLSFDGEEFVKAGNVYWVDLGLTFVDSAIDADNPARTTQFDNEAKSIKKSTLYTVSDKTGWRVGYQVVARSSVFQYYYNLDSEGLSGDEEQEFVDYFIDTKKQFLHISGVPISYETDSRNFSLTQKDNMAELFSTKTGKVELTGMINLDEESAKNVTFTYLNLEGEKVTSKNIGHGTPVSTDHTALKLTTNWMVNGVQVEILAPKMIYQGISRDLYVRVLDDYGNPIADADVSYSISGVNKTDETSAGQTDPNGLVTITLPAADDISATTSVIRVTVMDSISKSASITYKANAEQEFKIDADNKDGAVTVDTAANTVEVYFTNAVDTSSIHAREFILECEDGTAYTVRSAVKGNSSKSILLTLDEKITQETKLHTLRIQKYTDEYGIDHILTDNDGQILDADEYEFKPIDYEIK